MKRLIFHMLLLAVPVLMYGQSYPVFNQYYLNPFINNPSAVGDYKYTQVFLSYRQHWAGIPDSPQTTILSINTPIEFQNMSVGVTLYNDNFHIISNSGAYANFVYFVDINSNHRIYFGLSPGVSSSQIYFDRLQADVSDETLLGSADQRVKFNTHFGLYYTFKRLKVGIAAHNLIENKHQIVNTNDNDIAFTVLRQYTATAGYSYQLLKDKKLYIEPLLMAQANEVTIRWDANLVVNWKDEFKAGVSYRYPYGLGFMASAMVQGLFTVGYSYDYPIGTISELTIGSHELMLGYRLYRKGEKPIRMGDIYRKTRRQQSQYAQLIDNTDQKSEKEINRELKEKTRRLLENRKRDKQEITDMIKNHEATPTEIEDNSDEYSHFLVVGVARQFGDAKLLQTSIEDEFGVFTLIRQTTDQAYYLVYTASVATRKEAVGELNKINQSDIERITEHKIWIYKVRN